MERSEIREQTHGNDARISRSRIALRSMRATERAHTLARKHSSQCQTALFGNSQRCAGPGRRSFALWRTGLRHFLSQLPKRERSAEKALVRNAAPRRACEARTGRLRDVPPPLAIGARRPSALHRGCYDRVDPLVAGVARGQVTSPPAGAAPASAFRMSPEDASKTRRDD